MDITFRTTKLAKILNSEKELFRRFGPENAQIIKFRLAVLRAAPCLEVVPPQRPTRRHQLQGKLAEHFAVDVKNPDRIVFRPINDPLPRKADGGLDLTKITAIEIFEIGDYH